MAIGIIIFSFIIAAAIALATNSKRAMELSALAASTVALVATSIISYRVGSTGIDYRPLSFINVDALAALVLLLIAIVAFFTSLYSVPYFQKEMEKGIIGQSRVQQYYILVNLFLAAMFLSASASHPVVAWIFLEATTLATTFLISYYNRPTTVEAAWKYLIINSTGLLIGFLGTLLYFTSFGKGGSDGFIDWTALTAHAAGFNPAIAKIAFIFILVGYGTKVGLAPMHTWKPDAYSKSPAPLGALFSGALLPVAFVTLLRFRTVTDIAAGHAFSQHLLISFGILSIVIAALSMLAVKNYRRLLAYSSIEHAGIMAIGFGFGGIGAFAATLHMIYHSFIKSSLFYTSGNFLLRYNSSHISDIRGVLAAMPVTGILFIAGFLAATGLPPFGIFLSELFTLYAGLAHYWYIVAIAVLAMAIAFVGFFRHTSAMMFGEKPKNIKAGETDIWLVIPPLALLALVLVMTFYTPPFVQTLIREVAARY